MQGRGPVRAQGLIPFLSIGLHRVQTNVLFHIPLGRVDFIKHTYSEDLANLLNSAFLA